MQGNRIMGVISHQIHRFHPHAKGEDYTPVKVIRGHFRILFTTLGEFSVSWSEAILDGNGTTVCMMIYNLIKTFSHILSHLSFTSQRFRCSGSKE